MDERSAAFSDPHARVARFSFWKPEPPPGHDRRIQPVELLSLGPLAGVAAHLLDVPKMAAVALPPWEKAPERERQLLWAVDGGILLRVKAEETPPKPGEVLTIHALNAASERAFYRLYIQIFEQFGVTVLDERNHQFLTPREFRARLN